MLQRRQQPAPLQDALQTTPTTTQESPAAARPAKNANGRTPLPTSRPKATSGRGALPTARKTRAATRTAAPVGGVSRPTTTRAAATAATAAARNPLRPSTRRHVQIVSRAARPAADGAAAAPAAAVSTPDRTSTYTGRRLLPNGRTALPTAPTPSLIVSARYTPGRLRIVEGQLQRVALGEDAQVSDGSQQPPPALALRQQAAVPDAHTLSPDEAEGAGAEGAAKPPRAPRPAMAVLATQTSPASIAEAAAALPPILPSTPSATEISQTQTQTQPAHQKQQHWMYKRVLETDAVCDTCHRMLGEVMAATSRGDGANIARLGRVVQQCLTCGRSTCRACFDADRRDPRHPLHRLILDWAAPASPPASPAGSADSRGGKDDSSGGGGGSAPSSQDQPSSAAMSVDLPRGDSADDGPALGGGDSGGAVAADASALGDSYTPIHSPAARTDGRGFPPTVTLNSGK